MSEGYKDGYDSDDSMALIITGFDMFEINFWNIYPRRESTPTIQGNKKLIEKIIREAIKAGEITWMKLKISVELYAKSDKVRDGYVQMQLTFVRAQGWNYEYEIPKTEREIIAAKPLSERTPEDWQKILGEPTEWNKALLAKNMDRVEGAPREILEMYGLKREA